MTIGAVVASDWSNKFPLESLTDFGIVSKRSAESQWKSFSGRFSQNRNCFVFQIEAVSSFLTAGCPSLII